jgi:invasion protein IalB
MRSVPALITPARLTHKLIASALSLCFALVLALCFALVLAMTHPLQAQIETKASFGDWHVNCGKPPGAKDLRCALVQRVIDEERSNVGLRVVFLLTSDGQNVLRVVAPLGVLLPFGLGLRIDDEPIGKQPLPFIRCRPMGCISEIIVKKKLLDKFKAGTTAMFIIVETKKEGRAIPVSLKGFTKGLERLSELAKSKSTN